MSQADLLREADAFFGGASRVQRTVGRLAKNLESLGIDYAVVGGLAVGHYGRPRMTEDVDVLVTPEGLERFKASFLGWGYLEKFPGSRGVRDAETRVPIDFLLTGGFPGDGKPKSLRYPDPASVAEAGDVFRVVTLPVLIDLKIATGMTVPARHQDLADVVAIVRARMLPESFADRLHPFVQEKYRQLWKEANEPPEVEA